MNGKIHSIESGAMLDGKGIRLAVFMHGCPLRCKFCHNPDTWASPIFEEKSAEEILDAAKKYVDFFRLTGGGVTLSGGEPLMQKDFVLELAELLHKNGISLVIDTCGHVDIDQKLFRIAELTSTFLLDIKHIDPKSHLELTGKKQKKNFGLSRFHKK